MATEKRLISYDVLIKHLDSCIKEGKGLFKSVCVAIKCFVEQMPTVDAVEVVHSEWIMVIDENDCERIECPLCGEQFYDGDNDTFDKPYNYCPNCGAQMDGDGNGS